MKKISPVQLALLCVIGVCIVGFLDYATGYEISFFIFYALPIGCAAWYGGQKQGMASALFSIVIWFIADNMTGHVYSHDLIPFWNGMIRFIFFIFTAYAVAAIKEKIKLEELNADFDALTGILNGRGFRKKAEAVLPFLKREKYFYALAFIDVDNFKQVNDTKGHAEGDRILMEVARIMKDSLRESDMVARLGGDEFIIFLPRTDMVKSKSVLQALKEKMDTVVRENGWPIGFSIGLGVFDGGLPLETAITKADTMMYQAKKGGKNSISFMTEAAA